MAASFQPNGAARRLSGDIEPNPVALKDMCTYCFDALLEHFTGQPQQAPRFKNALCPLFVTWTKLSPSGGARLRGCIGTLDPHYIHKGLRDYALTSALHDRRFSPMSWKEVPHLQCTVSLLTNYEDADHHLDWEVGKHGLVLEFKDPQNGGRHSATYLPEIARDEGWTHEECIESLMRKSGFSGKITPELKRSAKLTRYQSTKVSLTYKDYIQSTTSNGNSQVHADGFVEA